MGLLYSLLCIIYYCSLFSYTCSYSILQDLVDDEEFGRILELRARETRLRSELTAIREKLLLLKSGGKSSEASVTAPSPSASIGDADTPVDLDSLREKKRAFKESLQSVRQALEHINRARDARRRQMGRAGFSRSSPTRTSLSASSASEASSKRTTQQTSSTDGVATNNVAATAASDVDLSFASVSAIGANWSGISSFPMDLMASADGKRRAPAPAAAVDPNASSALAKRPSRLKQAVSSVINVLLFRRPSTPLADKASLVQTSSQSASSVASSANSSLRIKDNGVPRIGSRLPILTVSSMHISNR